MGLAAFCGLAWVAQHLIEVAAVSATCGILAVAASIWLFRWADRRDAQRAQLWTVRADAVTPPRMAAAVPPAGSRPAIAPAIVLNFYGVDSGDMAARVIRTAIPGTSVDANTEGK